MDKLALKYHELGFNCSQCILKAFEESYNTKISPQIYESCKAMYAGFGVGCMCNMLVAGIMAFGIMLDEMEAKQARILLLSEVQEKYGSLNCASLRDEHGCQELIADVARRIDIIISEKI